MRKRERSSYIRVGEPAVVLAEVEVEEGEGEEGEGDGAEADDSMPMKGKGLIEGRERFE